MKLSILPFSQPIGDFALAVMKASDIWDISFVDRMMYDPETDVVIGSVQREADNSRIKKIREYACTEDATFPTPILLAVRKENYEIDFSNLTINLDGTRKFAEIIDGQHRMLGLVESGRLEEFEIPVVFVLDPTIEQKALIFAVINSNQTKVPLSIVYSLYSHVNKRTPEKVLHTIASALNAKQDSPFYHRIKMLGKKVHDNESLSQGTFVDGLKPLLESSLKEMYDTEQDAVIAKIIFNAYGAAKYVWEESWDSDQSILRKTTGFLGIAKALETILPNAIERGDVSQFFFVEIFEKVNELLNEYQKNLDNIAFPAGGKGQAFLRDFVLLATDRAYQGLITVNKTKIIKKLKDKGFDKLS